MGIHKEGFVIILFTLLIIIAINVGAHYIAPSNKFMQYLLYIITSLVFILIIQFFRNPDRSISPDESIIVAPADGKVVVIEEVEEPEFFKGKRKQISIFMSPLNVHVNWYPISGKIKYFKYHPGSYLVAWHPKSSTLNERTTIVVENKNKKAVLKRQIAGAVARRIVCYSEEDKSIIQGEQLGFIKFGSRVDLFLPLDAEIKVELDQAVVGCKTVIASF